MGESVVCLSIPSERERERERMCFSRMKLQTSKIELQKRTSVVVHNSLFCVQPGELFKANAEMKLKKSCVREGV